MSNAERPITLMTYNVKNPDPAHDWPARLPVLLEVVRRHDPDVLCVQEAFDHQMDDLRAGLPELPLDVAGTAFQQAVWRELSRVPPGETPSYAALAARAGRPKAVRATGTACGQNQVAVLIPCHRAKRADGSLGGYAYGLERKIELLKREGAV